MYNYIENVVIGNPAVSPSSIFASSPEDWSHNEFQKTFFTEERFLPRILLELKVIRTISELRRNKPELVTTLNKPDFLEIKWGKRKLWILVGE